MELLAWIIGAIVVTVAVVVVLVVIALVVYRLTRPQAEFQSFSANPRVICPEGCGVFASWQITNAESTTVWLGVVPQAQLGEVDSVQSLSTDGSGSLTIPAEHDVFSDGPGVYHVQLHMGGTVVASEEILLVPGQPERTDINHDAIAEIGDLANEREYTMSVRLSGRRLPEKGVVPDGAGLCEKYMVLLAVRYVDQLDGVWDGHDRLAWVRVLDGDGAEVFRGQDVTPGSWMTLDAPMVVENFAEIRLTQERPSGMPPFTVNTDIGFRLTLRVACGP